MSTPTADASASAPDPSATSGKSSKDCIKQLLYTSASDFRVVFFYPLCTGIMTGVGFIVGKRLGEAYFYGSAKTV